jgi:alkanesulfonate monooxygenase SsuD/methylene tetrahydromethanopterin reductase-like flavin-dependent oxidoreductase (luciferase family)
MADDAVARAARIGDGWFPQFGPDPRAGERLELFRARVRAAGRDPARVGIEARISLSNAPEAEWERSLTAWRDLGVTHLSFNTMNAGLATPRDHIDAKTRFMDVARAFADA